MKPPEVLLFDLGGVLIENVMFDQLPDLLPDPIEVGDLRTRWLYSPSVQAFERGRTSTDEFVAEFISEWELTATPAQFLKSFSSWPKGPYPGALELLDQLRDRYRLALLSNCNPIHWGRVSDVRLYTEAAFSSHLLGMVKPDPLIFEHVVAELGVQLARAWFFDDSLTNVEAARSIGMQAYQADGIHALRHIIGELGL